jgi:uncharacterized protein (TIGR02271 family)
MSDSRDTHDGRMSLMEKIKGKLHLGHHKDKDPEYVSYHTANPACQACQAGFMPDQVYQPGFVPAQPVFMPVATPATYPSPVYNPGYASAGERLVAGENFAGATDSHAYDSRDLNRDGHLSTGEKLAGATGSPATEADNSHNLNRDDEKFAGSAHATGAYDSRDPNRDDHLSMGEKFTGVTGAPSAQAYDSRDLDHDGHTSAGEKLAGSRDATHATGTFDPRNLNRDGHVSMGEKFAGSTGVHNAAAHDSRDLNRDGRISAEEKLAAGIGHVGTSQIAVGGDTRFILYEEQLVVSKRETTAGDIAIHKRVREEHVQQSVPVTREEFVVERRPLTGAADYKAGIVEPDEISRVILYRDEIIRHRRLVPTEEVIVRKKIVMEHEIVGATLRSERIETKQLVGPAVAGAANQGGQKLAAVAGSSTVAHDARDANRDGHVSAGENLKAVLGTNVGVGNETHLTLHEEQLVVSKREINAGELDIYKHVEEEHVQQSVPLRREELVLERRPLTGAVDTSPAIATPDEIMRFILHREEIVVEKRRVPTEEVIVRKKIVTQHETVSDTLRWEEIEAEPFGGVHSARDSNSDGHVSTGEKFQTTGAVHNALDANHVSTAEKLGAVGTTNAKAARG